MEKAPKGLKDIEVALELKKDFSKIDFDDLIERCATNREREMVYGALEYELRHMAGGNEKWNEALLDWGLYSRNVDYFEEWFAVTRLHELMGRPFKLAPLPEWAREALESQRKRFRR